MIHFSHESNKLTLKMYYEKQKEILSANQLPLIKF